MSSRRTRVTPRVWLRLLAVSAGAVVAFAAGTVPADAHNVLRSTSPGDEEVVTTTPTSVVLTFNEPAIAMGTQVLIIGPGGPVQTGAPRLVDNTVTQDLQPGAPAGPYNVSWRVTSVDGHPISGAYAFTVRPAASGPSSAPPQPSPSSPTASPAPAVPTAPTDRIPGGLTLPIGALVVIAVAILGIRRARRRPGSPNRPPLD